MSRHVPPGKAAYRQVRARGAVVPLHGARRRAVLGTLALRANQLVSVGQLAEAVWPHPPPSATSNLRTHVAALRRRLGIGPEDCLVTEPSGYRLVVRPGQLDVLVFEELCDQGETALEEAEIEQAVACFRAARQLWRGPVPAGVPVGLGVQADVARLEERRLRLEEQYAAARSAWGEPGSVADELRGLVAEHPLRERLWAELMRALYRMGRQADALAAYQEARGYLVDEMGIEPGPELERLEQAILRQDPELDQTGQAPAVPGGPQLPESEPMPCQLPTDVAHFTGRTEEVTGIGELLAGRQERGTVVTTVIAGPPGVGKTSLAVHVAHQLRDDFPDGQLFAPLHDAEGCPVDPAWVLARFLRALGADEVAIPETLAERAEAYRARLAGRRVLVVLDNAVDETQVLPLLPGSESCGVILTGRAPITGLPGSEVFELARLEPGRARELLAQLAGAQRIADEPDAAAELVRLCAALPLALRVVGAQLAAKRHWSLAQLVERLADERNRLDELAYGSMDVRASLALSYQELSSGARMLLRRLAMLDTPDTAAWVGSALLDTDPARVVPLYEELVDAQLLDPAGRDAAGQTRYRLHELIRVFARERAVYEDDQEQRDDCWCRVIECCACTACAAVRQLTPELSSRGDEQDSCVVPLPEQSSALHWLAAELHTVVVVIRQAAAADVVPARLLSRLAGYLGSYCDQCGSRDDARAAATAVLDRARRHGDWSAEADAHAVLGSIAPHHHRPGRAVADRDRSEQT